MKHVDTRSAKSKYLEVSELGTRFNLSFSSQLEFGNKIIALDGRKKFSVIVLLFNGDDPRVREVRGDDNVAVVEQILRSNQDRNRDQESAVDRKIEQQWVHERGPQE